MTVVGADGKTEKPRSKRVVADPPDVSATPAQTGSDKTADSEETETQPPTPSPGDCPQLLRGECPHGLGGKTGGVCQYLHRARCSTYMKWGDKSEKGCKKVPCDKLHPLLCPRSLNL